MRQVGRLLGPRIGALARTCPLCRRHKARGDIAIRAGPSAAPPSDGDRAEDGAEACENEHQVAGRMCIRIGASTTLRTKAPSPKPMAAIPVSALAGPETI